MQGKTVETLPLFKRVEHPTRTIRVSVESISLNHQERYSRLLNIYINGKFWSFDPSDGKMPLDEIIEKSPSIYRGPLDEVVTKDIAADGTWLNKGEYNRKPGDETKRLLSSFSEKGERYGLRWFTDRFVITERADNKFYYPYEREIVKRQDDDLYVSYDEQGHAERIILCDPDVYPDLNWDQVRINQTAAAKPADAEKLRGKVYGFGHISFCSHQFLYASMNVKVKLHYHAELLPQWPAIENAVRARLKMYQEKPKETDILRCTRKAQ